MTGMTCANCAMTIERTLKKKVPGVVNASVNFASERATVEYIPSLTGLDEMIQAIEKAGYGAIRPDDTLEGDDAELQARRAEIEDQTAKFAVGLAFTIPLFVLSMGRDFGLFGPWAHAAMGQLAFSRTGDTRFSSTRGGITIPGVSRASGTEAPTWTCWWPWGRRLPMFTLWPFSSFPAFGHHVYFETSAVIITLIKLGKMLEARTKGRTGGAIRKLMKLRPKTAFIEVDGQEKEIPVSQVRVGDRIIVRPGEAIPGGRGSP